LNLKELVPVYISLIKNETDYDFSQEIESTGMRVMAIYEVCLEDIENYQNKLRLE